MDVCSLLFGFSLREKINVRKYLLQMFVYFTSHLMNLSRENREQFHYPW